jgi:hypothetical protein
MPMTLCGKKKPPGWNGNHRNTGKKFKPVADEKWMNVNGREGIPQNQGILPSGENISVQLNNHFFENRSIQFCFQFLFVSSPGLSFLPAPAFSSSGISHCSASSA